jgi:hypothetical protein
MATWESVLYGFYLPDSVASYGVALKRVFSLNLRNNGRLKENTNVAVSVGVNPATASWKYPPADHKRLQDQIL